MRGRAVQDLSGVAFGRLTVLRHVGSNAHRVSMWECRCECGTIKTVIRSVLKSGESRSCGCLDRERRTTHGHCKPYTGEYRSWRSMLARCSDASRKSYGGRGIVVCDRWAKFEHFIADMGLKPSPRHTLDRINSNGNYEKQNCRWANWTEQGRNRSSNHLVEFKGEQKVLAAWAEHLGIKPYIIYARVTRGVTDPEKLFAMPRTYRGKRS